MKEKTIVWFLVAAVCWLSYGHYLQSEELTRLKWGIYDLEYRLKNHKH